MEEWGKQCNKEKKMSSGEIIESKNLKISMDEKSQGNINLDFNGEMTIYSVDKIKNVILDKMADAESIEADLSEVSRIDTSVFQLLIKAQIEAEETDKSFKIVNPSKETKRIFNLYGETL
jgi:anti-anti-sigma factor